MTVSLSASGNAESRNVHLRVMAGSPLAEVFLINDEFALVNRSVGELNAEVAPGVYKVKSRLGDATAERLVLLDEDQDLDVSGDLLVRSPVPLAEAPYARAREVEVTRAPRDRASFGDDAEVFLMTRSTATPSDAPELSLRTEQGTTVASLDLPSRSAPGQRSSRISIDPGAYFVRQRDRFGYTAEQCVYALSGWQTQVFALAEPGDEADIGSTRVSVLMARHDFDPGDAQLHLVEEARTALAEERKVASDTLADICEAVDNPMLMLFGAHLMLIARDTSLVEQEQRASGRLDEHAVVAPVSFDQGRFDRIVDRLAELLGGGHPDVVALATERSGQALTALPPISAPPMLWRSWVLLIAASNAAPSLVPVSTWQRTVHGLPLRPFFLWAPAEESSEAGEEFTRSIAASLEGSQAGSRGSRGQPTRSLDTAGPDQGAASDTVRRHVSEKLLVPRAAIDKIAAREPL